ncbi:Coenzyme F420 hydrogenase/dehydrogenase, beta subunit C-terminal domain [Fusobacterium perfoetens]|uniref:Coenzyme F420 hydrogenase/dehydrogenase, beta subunit C-terminal domain n=1 Tax=Fusobacterium perfoetens TaxID=852 RepID=UPI001F1659F9|nr:Coenzyme F420 hydrogenase/dehydrogenase, beta subunit C-terminal domain [Fusobacterium perfoetens]MCF2612838.1 Coenzyme F420 hydrogenase/dehydrogenase, beta subunit C-terminal domain [Fusobacterium perfoetens]
MEICSSELCTGCFVCANICPVSCIEMFEDERGFLYPKINESKCIKCYKCQINCPINKKDSDEKNTFLKVFCAQSLKDNVLKVSSSGGMFYEIARFVIENKRGVVYASETQKNLSIKFSRIEKMEQLNKVHGSKYFQSIVGNIYTQVKEDLQCGKEVLFIGCPCQIAGINSYLQKKYSNLVTVDLVCHGVGSFKLFNEEIKKQEKKNDEIVDIKFRSKDKFTLTNHYLLKYVYKSGKVKYQSALNNRYMSAFFHEAIYRESCYKCKFSSIPRRGDLTIGDFAGVNIKEISRLRYKKGVSLLMVNTIKGAKIFEGIKNEIWYNERKLEEALSTNINLGKCCTRPPERDLLDNFENSNEYILNKMKYTLKNKIGICFNYIKKVIK